MTKYRVTGWAVKIEPVECERESVSSVWIKGRSERKAGTYFDSFEQAKAFLIERETGKVHLARHRLACCNDSLDNAKGLRI